MFFGDLIRRRLVSVLRPWLRDEPDLEIKIGFFRSHGTLRNLAFNTSALNELLDDPSRFCYKQVTVQELRLNVSAWSSPSFTLELHGLHVTLSAGEEKDEQGIKWKPRIRDTTFDDMKKVLADIDPEGSALREAITRIADIKPRSRATSLGNTILRHCQFRMHDTHVILQTAGSVDALSCLLEIKELSVESQFMKCGCFVTEFVTSLFVPSWMSALCIDIKGVKVGLRSEKWISSIIPSTDMLIAIKMKDFQFMKFDLRVPAVNFSLSPLDIYVVFVFYALVSKDSRYDRTGRQLWTLAAKRVISQIRAPKMLLIKVVSDVCRWLHYVHICNKLLALVGYPVEENIKRSSRMMLRDKTFSRCIKHQLQLILEIERELPTDAIAQAWKIIRYKTSYAQETINTSEKLLLNKFFWKIYELLVLIWTATCKVVLSVVHLSVLQKASANHPKNDFEIACEGSLTQHSIGVNVGEFTISVFSEKAFLSNASRDMVSGFDSLLKGLRSLRISIDAFVLTYYEDVSQRSFVFACGCAKVVSSSITRDGSSNVGGIWKKKVYETETTLWSEPAKVIHSADGSRASTSNDTAEASGLDHLIRRMWLNWATFCSDHKGSFMHNLENPFILCESKSFLIDQHLKNPTCGIWDCGVMVGRLHFCLGLPSIVLIAVLFSQVESVLSWADSGRITATSHLLATMKNPPVSDWNSTYRSYSSKIETIVCSMLPKKHIQLGVLITGPCIQLSLGEEGFRLENADRYKRVEKDQTCLCLDVNNIELTVSPNLESHFASRVGSAEFHGVESEVLRPQDPQMIEIIRSDNDFYKSQGLISVGVLLRFDGMTTYFAESFENQHRDILKVKPTIIKLSSLRKYLHSFGSTVVNISVRLHCVASGFTSLLFMDEIFQLAQVVSLLFHAVSHSLAAGSGLSCQELLGMEMLDTGSGSERMSTSKAKQGNLFITDAQFVFGSTYDLKSMEIFVANSRKMYEGRRGNVDTLSGGKHFLNGMTAHGVHISILQSYLEFYVDGGKAEIRINISDFRSVLFKHPSESMKIGGQDDLINLALSENRLYEGSFSYCEICCNLRTIIETLSSTSLSSNEGSGGSSFDCVRVHITTSDVYLVGCPLKYVLVQEHDPNKLDGSLSVQGDFQSISWQSQGGRIFLETTAFVEFIQCFTTYYCCMKYFWRPTFHGEGIAAGCGSCIAAMDSHPSQSLQLHQAIMWDQFERATVNLSDFLVILLCKDESGGYREFLLEGTIQFNLEMPNMIRNFSVGISKLSFLSHLLSEPEEQERTREIRVHRFSPSSLLGLSSVSLPGDISVASGHMDRIDSAPGGAICSHTVASSDGLYMNRRVHSVLNTSPWNYIVKELNIIMVAERPSAENRTDLRTMNHVWLGNGSISGFDLTISLSDIQVILSAIESLSGAFAKEPTNNVDRRANNQEPENVLEGIVPDGAIVAIQDVCQHLYIAVDGQESKYNVVGAIHYSLAGERALFRVKYHTPKIWKSPVRYFSLISLYAKGDSGELLSLNSRPRSDFVGISGSDNSAWGLWRILPCKPYADQGGIEQESYHRPAKNTFHLVNKKNDSAIAFVDDVLEFVSKPGNLFKWKVFNEQSPAGNVSILSSRPMEGTDQCQKLHVNDKKVTGTMLGLLSGITITIEEANLTIVHELPDRKEKVPLLRGSMSAVEVIIQILTTKARVMSTFPVMFYYFDAQRNLWRDFIHPLEVCLFYRSRFLNEDSDHILCRELSHLYARIKKFNISMTETSLDILLFAIGNLNLAGPYAVRSSVILANCCKVENNTGMSLLCQFHDNLEVLVARRQSTTLVLRHLASSNQLLESSLFSIRLVDQGAFSTTPIHISIFEDQEFAWRTRIASAGDSKTWPGPVVVVKVSRESEEGLSITISPLLRIHNETDFPLELRFQRPQQKETELAYVVLGSGDKIDDSAAAFDAISLSGGLKRALLSLTIGNFLLSFRPSITDGLSNNNLTAEWSNEIKGGKPVRLSGIFDKLHYQVRNAISAESVKYLLSTAHCALTSEDGQVASIYFLIQSIWKDVPVMHPNGYRNAPTNKDSPVVLQEWKEISLLPTVQISNILDMEIHVKLTDADPQSTLHYDNIYSQATIPSGSTVNLYANPETIYFAVTLTELNTSCKPINSSDWVRNLKKQKGKVRHLDVELEFGCKDYRLLLRLSCADRGILQATIFTSYTLENDTDVSLFCCAANQKPVSRAEVEKLGYKLPPELGYLLPPKSCKSWMMKNHKIRLKLLEEKASDSLLDLDKLSGLTEIDLEVEERSGSRSITKLAVSLKPPYMNKGLHAQIVSMNLRYVLFNEAEESITVRQCYLEDDMEGVITIDSKQKAGLRLRNGVKKKREINIFENFLRKHSKSQDDPVHFIQFRPVTAGLGWSGPVCVGSLGRFFLKFRKALDLSARESDQVMSSNSDLCEFAAVFVAEEGSNLVLRFHKPPNVDLPYRIENCLRDTPLTYYQKGSSEPEVLGSGSSVHYVWDDMTLPRKLVLQINDVHLIREINLDKVRPWKPFYRTNRHIGLGFSLLLNQKPKDDKIATYDQLIGTKTANLGFEVYADGLTRVLRICEFSDRRKGVPLSLSSARLRLQISHLVFHLLEQAKEEMNLVRPPTCSPVVIIRLENINLDSTSTDQHKVYIIKVQSFSVDLKWNGAPFAAMLRRHQSDYSEAYDGILHLCLVQLPSSSNVKQIKYLSIVLQPLDLNLDEETLMRIVPFWRSSLNSSTSSRQQYYFDHFEIHPIKFVASFLPGDTYSGYSSAQEMLRSLLHSVIKVPTVKNMIVELNGILVTHALITLRELCVKCAQHYSWYAMRAVYIAKGSPLLPPAFASVFDDMASSSLDVFFDPSSGLISLPGLTIGTFKLIRKCIYGKGFSGTKRYFGDLGKTLKIAGSSILFAAVTEVSDSVLSGAEASGFNGMVSGFHQGILKLAMEPSVLGSAVMEGGPDRKIMLDRSPGVDESYIEGYLQAMLDTIYKQEYLRVRVFDNQVVLKNLPPNSSLIDEIMERVKRFLVDKALLKGDLSTASHSLHHIRADKEWRVGPTLLTLCEHLFVSFAIRMLRKQANKIIGKAKWKKDAVADDEKSIVPTSQGSDQKVKFAWKWGVGKFVLSGIVAYIDGRLCRCIPNPIARRVVSGFLLSFLDSNDSE